MCISTMYFSLRYTGNQFNCILQSYMHVNISNKSLQVSGIIIFQEKTIYQNLG